MSRALQIKDFPGYYVTDTGDVYSRISDKYHNIEGRIHKIKPFMTNSGRLIVNLTKNGVQYHKQVHRLVASAFIPNPENKPEVNHIDGDPTNNTLINLEFCTKSENELHKYRILNKGHFLGKKHWLSKKILQIKNGKVIAEFYGGREAERETGIKSSNIYACCNKKPHYKTAGGYNWEYA